ncbi:hypothetical protein, partial [Rhizobium rhizogenes]|uniref:hypothetical protein n=1 Tax=Rhizobium rhizogenes TaxID=359 RepID=UPI001A9C6AD2
AELLRRNGISQNGKTSAVDLQEMDAKDASILAKLFPMKTVRAAGERFNSAFWSSHEWTTGQWKAF